MTEEEIKRIQALEMKVADLRVDITFLKAIAIESKLLDGLHTGAIIDKEDPSPAAGLRTEELICYKYNYGCKCCKVMWRSNHSIVKCPDCNMETSMFEIRKVGIIK